MEEGQDEGKRQKNMAERIIGTSNGANAERNSILLELSIYMKIRFSSYKNKLKFGCY